MSLAYIIKVLIDPSNKKTLTNTFVVQQALI